MEANGGPMESVDFGSIMIGLKTVQKQLEVKLAEARAAYDEINEEKKKIDMMIRAAEGTGKYSPRGTYTKQAKKDFSEETLETFWQRVRAQTFNTFEDIPGGFSANDLVDKLGVHKSTSQRLVRTLRDQGRVRLVGERYDERTNPSHTGKPFAVYVLNDE